MSTDSPLAALLAVYVLVAVLVAGAGIWSFFIGDGSSDHSERQKHRVHSAQLFFYAPVWPIMLLVLAVSTLITLGHYAFGTPAKHERRMKRASSSTTWHNPESE